MLAMSAWAKIDGDTSIQYHTCVDREVEFDIGGVDGLDLLVTKKGLENLVAVARAALCALEPSATAD